MIQGAAADVLDRGGCAEGFVEILRQVPLVKGEDRRLASEAGKKLRQGLPGESLERPGPAAVPLSDREHPVDAVGEVDEQVRRGTSAHDVSNRLPVHFGALGIDANERQIVRSEQTKDIIFETVAVPVEERGSRATLGGRGSQALTQGFESPIGLLDKDKLIEPHPGMRRQQGRSRKPVAAGRLRHSAAGKQIDVDGPAIPPSVLRLTASNGREHVEGVVQRREFQSRVDSVIVKHVGRDARSVVAPGQNLSQLALEPLEIGDFLSSGSGWSRPLQSCPVLRWGAPRRASSHGSATSCRGRPGGHVVQHAASTEQQAQQWQQPSGQSQHEQDSRRNPVAPTSAVIASRTSLICRARSAVAPGSPSPSPRRFGCGRPH